MDKKELNDIVALKNIETIEIALKNRGWVNAQTHKEAGEVSIVDLFKSTKVLSSKSVKDKDVCYKMDIYDNVVDGEKWLWAVLSVDRKYMKGWRPVAIKIYIKEK